jgi:hypothetical protein
VLLKKLSLIERRKGKKFRRARSIAPAAEMNHVSRRREFCTIVHRFAQVFDTNLIDGANGNIYFAFQIEPVSLRTLRINLEGAANLTVVAPRD